MPLWLTNRPVSHLAQQDSGEAVNSMNPAPFIFDFPLNMDHMVDLSPPHNLATFGQNASVVQPMDLPLDNHVHFPSNPQIPNSSLLPNTGGVLGATDPSTGGVDLHMIPGTSLSCRQLP